MSSLLPFKMLHPTPQNAARLCAPPYDVPGDREARALVKEEPLSFLHVTRPETGMPADADAHSPEAYAHAEALFEKWCDEALLQQEEVPCYAIYRLTWRGRSQTGLVALASVSEYRTGLVKRHELTRPDKEDDRTKHITLLQAQTGPVFLAFRSQTVLEGLLAELSVTPPEFDVEKVDGVRHEIWFVRDLADVKRLQAASAALDAVYICDGHHRAAAGARASDAFKHLPEAMGILSVSFPESQLRILPYHRLVADLNGKNGDDVHAAIRAVTAEPKDASAPPETEMQGEFCYYLAGKWTRRALTEVSRTLGNASDRLDVSVIQNLILDPVLGIDDPRTNPRIRFVGGIKGPGELSRAVDAGEAAIGFAVAATTMRELLAVADAGLLMPPKSTWFEPKLRDGFIVHAW